MAKVSMPQLSAKWFSGWAFVLFAGLLLALYAIIDGGGFAEQGSSGTPAPAPLSRRTAPPDAASR